MLGMPRRFTNQNVDGMITTNLNNGVVGDGNGTEDPGQWIPAGKYQSGADQGPPLF